MLPKGVKFTLAYPTRSRTSVKIGAVVAAVKLSADSVFRLSISPARAVKTACPVKLEVVVPAAVSESDTGYTRKRCKAIR